MEESQSEICNSSVQFSPLFIFSGKACKCSPDREFILFTVGKQVEVIQRDTQQSVFTLFCSDRVDYAEWSQDSTMILCIIRRNCSIEIFSILDLTWNMAIKDESSVITSATWAPNSQNILSTNEYNLQTSIWSIHSKKVYDLPGVYDLRRCCRFSRDGAWLACLFRQFVSTSQQQDQISIINTTTWECVHSFSVCTQNARLIEWCLNDSCIAVCDHYLYNRYLIYSCDGKECFRKEGDSSQLGSVIIQSAYQLPLLCCAGYEGNWSLIDLQKMVVICENNLATSMTSSSVSFNIDRMVYIEKPKSEVLEKHKKDHPHVDDSQPDEFERSVYATAGDYFFDIDKTIPIQSIINPVKSMTSAREVGIHQVSFSSNDRYLVLKDNTRPSVLWIWDIKRDRLLSQIVFVTPVISYSWHPTKSILAILTSNQTIYLWEAGLIVWAVLTAKIIGLSSMNWTGKGDGLLLVGGESFQLCSLCNL